MVSKKLQEHMTDLEKFLEGIKNTYQKYKNYQKPLKFYIAKSFLQIQEEVEDYKSKS